jgi:hypothetical protein
MGHSGKCGRTIRSVVCKLGVLLALALLFVGCSNKPATAPAPSARPAITAVQAIQAFETLYPGFEARSAREYDGSWVIEGSSVKDSGWNAARPFPVRVPIQVDGTGVVTATVDGVRWSGTQDLAALLKSKRDSFGAGWSIANDLPGYVEAPGSTVVGVGVGRAGKVAVRIDTRAGPRPLLLYAWHKYSYWTATVRYSAAQWKHQAQVLGASLNTLLSARDDDKPAEPLGSPRPVDGQFTARIVAADAAKCTVTIDRFQVFTGDAAYAAAIQDDPRNKDSLGSAFYTRNLISEHTVLHVNSRAVVTRFYSEDVWSPRMASTLDMVTAIDVDEFFREYQTERAFRLMLRGAGATIIVSDGEVIAIVGNNSP